MSRRVCSDQLFQKKKKQKEIQRRKENKRAERVRVLIACEGEKTEPYYFESLIEDNKLSAGSVVIATHKHTNPSGVLKDLLNHLKKDSEFEHKWIVIDRDENAHSLVDFNNVFQSAKNKKVEIAYSNPSFEFWYLIHFDYYHSALNRYEVVKLLKKKHLHGYEKKTQNVFHTILSKQKIAIRNSKRLLKFHEITDTINPAKNNPSTTVHKLVELLNLIK